jgi:hypothetical protein
MQIVCIIILKCIWKEHKFYQFLIISSRIEENQIMPDVAQFYKRKVASDGIDKKICCQND